ncbi:hypothetical protein EPO17_01095 [Patescibacteria group bacterium]|nr:MAG: hypothetical protein EPO17_01095 [Patescibacteria group bacterium]
MNIQKGTIERLLRNEWYDLALHYVYDLPVSTMAERYRKDSYLVCIIVGSLKKDTADDTLVASRAAYFLSEVEPQSRSRKRAYLDGPIAVMRIKYRLF